MKRLALKLTDVRESVEVLVGLRHHLQIRRDAEL
jgi:hypothetical protein